MALSASGKITGDISNKATFDNAGTVSGKLTNTVSGTVNANGGTFTGLIDNQGVFNINNATVWSNGFANSGTVNLKNTASGNLTNSGVVFVAAGDNVTLTGNYTQNAGGVLQFGLDASSDPALYGKLNISGTANLSASDALAVKVTADTTIKAGDTYSVLTAGNLLLATPGQVTSSVADDSPLWRFIAVTNGNSIDLKAARALSIPDVINDTGIGTAALGAGAVLDQLVTNGASDPDMQHILDILGSGNLGGPDGVARAVAQLTPGINGGMAQATAGAIQSIGNVIQARQESAQGLSAGDETKAGYLWIKPFSSWADQGKRNGADGFDGNTWGAVLGADSLIDSRNRLGFAVAYARTDIDGKSNISGHHAEVNTYQAIAYGSHSLDDRTDVNVQVDGGINDNSGRRQIRFAGVNRIAKADYTGWNAHLGLGIRRMMNLDAKTTITPFVRADYTWVDNRGYTEKGANALNLKVNGKSLDELVVSVGGKLNYAVSAATNLSANLGVGYDLIGKDTSITSTFVGGGSAFQTEGIGQQRLRTRGGLGLTTTYGNGLETAVNYDIEARSQFTNQSLSVKVRMAF